VQAAPSNCHLSHAEEQFICSLSSLSIGYVYRFEGAVISEEVYRVADRGAHARGNAGRGGPPRRRDQLKQAARAAELRSQTGHERILASSSKHGAAHVGHRAGPDAPGRDFRRLLRCSSREPEVELMVRQQQVRKVNFMMRGKGPRSNVLIIISPVRVSAQSLPDPRFWQNTLIHDVTAHLTILP
jgi:hypothetical protein